MLLGIVEQTRLIYLQHLSGFLVFWFSGLIFANLSLSFNSSPALYCFGERREYVHIDS
jgi:hypothetical protein